MSMGTIISARNFSPQNRIGMLNPIIYCCQYTGVDEQAISLNLLLAKILIDYSLKQRTMQISRCFVEVLMKLPDEVIIKDFDVLFNPEYKVDMMKIMVVACKIKPFSAIWPGTLVENKLIYAEEGFKDYKTYSVEDYDVTCII